MGRVPPRNVWEQRVNGGWVKNTAALFTSHHVESSPCDHLYFFFLPLVTSLSTSSSVCFCTCPRGLDVFGSGIFIYIPVSASPLFFNLPFCLSFARRNPRLSSGMTGTAGIGDFGPIKPSPWSLLYLKCPVALMICM